MEIIPNGIESYWIEHAKSKHVSSIPRSLLFIGVFNDNKNILATMKVVENLSSRYEGLHLTLVGGGGNQHERVLKYCKLHPELFLIPKVLSLLPESRSGPNFTGLTY